MATLEISELSETAFWDEVFFERLTLKNSIKLAADDANEALKARRAAFTSGTAAGLKIAGRPEETTADDTKSDGGAPS